MPDDNGTKQRRVVSVVRALAILDVFAPGESSLMLSEIAHRTRLHKATVLRIARTMASARYLVQVSDKSWRLGPAACWLGSRYNLAFDLPLIAPVLREVSIETEECVSYYAREGNARICIAHADGTRPIHHPIQVGEISPLEKGAAGRLLLAFSNAPGETYERIRCIGYHCTAGERKPRISIVAFPVFGTNRSLVGCITVNGPRDHFDETTTAKIIRILRKAAIRLSSELTAKHAKHEKTLVHVRR